MNRLARFQREATVLASLNHPDIGAMYGLDEANEHQCLILEFVEGKTLAVRLAERPIPIDEAFTLAEQVAGVAEADQPRQTAIDFRANAWSSRGRTIKRQAPAAQEARGFI